MQEELYRILNLTPEASDAEIDANYAELKSKYSEDRFLEGDAGNEAARKLTELEAAYAEIKSMRKEPSAASDSGASAFSEAERNIRAGNLNKAQEILDSFSERGAEWHYLQSVVFYKKNWANESKKQLEISMQMEPNNAKYKQAYDRLTAKADAEQRQFTSGSGPAAQQGRPEYMGDDRQMGGNFCTDSMNCCAQFVCCNALLNCCCNCG